MYIVFFIIIIQPIYLSHNQSDWMDGLGVKRRMISDRIIAYVYIYIYMAIKPIVPTTTELVD